MRKIRLTTLCLLLAASIFCACGAGGNSSSSDSSIQEAESYAITYQGVKNYDKSLMDIPGGMMPVEKSYPAQYTLGESVIIDPLQYLATPSAEYQFLGYFQDAACTQSFDETMMTGETVIYALIQVYYTTPNV